MRKATIKQVVAASAALLAAACGGEYDSAEDWGDDVDQAEQEVRNGSLVTSGQGAIRITFPKNGSRYSCTGAIIGPRSFITAAHCFNHFGYGDQEVKVQVNYRDQGKWYCLSESSITRSQCNTDRKADAWINPGFKAVASGSNGGGKAGKDFAVVTMRRDFSYIRSAHQMYIMEEPNKRAIGTFTTIGYGRTDDSVSNNLPYRANFKLDGLKSTYYYSTGEDDKTGQQLCKGDSGSPQFESRSSSRYVFGLHSNRNPVNGGCGEDGTKQYGVVVAQFIDDIEDNIGYTCRHYNHRDYGRMADCWP